MRIWTAVTGVAILLAFTANARAQDAKTPSTDDDSAEATASGNSAAVSGSDAGAGSDAAADAKRSSARQLATDASLEYRTGNFEQAYDKFNRAFHLVGVPSLGLWSARSLRELNRLVESAERYREVIRKGAPPDAPAAHHQALLDAQAELEVLTPKIPNLIIVLQDAEASDVKVTLDGREVDPALLGVKQLVDPGKHDVVGTRAGEVVEGHITLRERQTEELQLKFRPGYHKSLTEGSATEESSADKKMSSTQKVGIALMATGGASLVVGVVTTVVAMGKQNDLKENCPNSACTPEFHDDVGSYNTMKGLSIATLIGAGVLGGVGATLYLTGKPKQENVALFVDGTRLGFQGAF